MKRIFVAVLALLIATPVWGASDGDIERQLKQLKEKVELLEKRLMEKEREAREKDEYQRRLSRELEEIRGIKEALKGISVEGSITITAQGTLNSDHGKGNLYSKETDMSYSANLIVSKRTDLGRFGYGIMSIYIEGADGPDSWLKDLQDSSWSSVNEDYASPVDMGNVDLREAWYEHHLFGDRLILTLGKLDVTAYVDENEVANDEEVQFMGGEFVNNPIIPFPDYGPGIRVTVSPSRYLEITSVFMSVEGDDETSSSWSDILSGVFGIGQVALKAEPFGLPGNYRLMGWFNTSRHYDYSKGEERNRNNYGFAVSLDQELIRETLSCFVRAGWAEPDLNEASYAVSFGARLSGRWWKRPKDELAASYGIIGESHEFREYQRRIGSYRTENQHHVEVYYKLSIGEHLELSLDYQFLGNPGGRRNVEDAHLLGMRLHFSL